MDNWKIIYEKWVPEEQPLREALCTLGNGFFATRGAAEECGAGGVHYPGTYLAGGYNRLSSEVSGQTIENEDLVNWPNWLPLTFRHQGEEEWFSIEQVEVLHYRLVLNMEEGVLIRHLRFRDKNERETSLTSRRFVSMAEQHLAAIQWEITPENWSGKIELCSAIDGGVINSGVPRYRELSSQHLKVIKTGEDATNDYVYLVAETVQSKVQMAQAVRTRIISDVTSCELERELKQTDDYVAHVFTAACEQQRPLQVEKIMALFTSRDNAISEPLLEAQKTVARVSSFAEILNEHRREWRHLWERSDLKVACNDRTQQILRLHIFHLLQTVSMHTGEADAGVPARGWHGEAYRGHIFWDELFIFPFLNLRLPELTRDLLLYRYRRLTEARFAAREAGYRGAMFPWQSGSNGREESQVIHLNPKSGNWIPDNTFLQRHINAAIAYNVWQYYQATNDIEFLTFYGAEMVFDIALFWSSKATWCEEKERYEIREVVGPDEYHTEYPNQEQPGLNNNAYTNVMAVWVLQCAIKLLDVLDDSRVAELFEQLRVSENELERWKDICEKMFIPFVDEDKQVIAQFEGYENLKELDWEKYQQEHGEAMRLDRILESEGDDPNNYKASKQADVLMLFYLFSTDELIGLFNTMGYNFNADAFSANIDYYQQRTSHGSTLSKIVHSWVFSRLDRKRSWNNFQLALKSDVEDVQGGTTPEGIHLGAMAGTVDLVQRCFAGLEIHDDILWLNPQLPDEIYYMEFQVRYRSHWISFRLTQEKIHISVDRGWSSKIKVGLKGEVHEFETGDKREFTL